MGGLTSKKRYKIVPSTSSIAKSDRDYCHEKIILDDDRYPSPSQYPMLTQTRQIKDDFDYVLTLKAHRIAI
jgi:hypothetical protein